MFESMTEAAAPLAGRRILIVEDEFMTADEIWTALEARGAEIVAAVRSVPKALAFIESSEAVDAAVIDINLDGEMAYPVVDALIARERPVVFATAYHRDQIPPRYQAIPHCAKPMQAPVLVREVQRVLNLRAHLPAEPRSRQAGAPPPDPMAAWIVAIAERRDRSAFTGLFLAVTPQIKAYMLRAGFAPWIAEGLAQDAMLRVWREASRFEASRQTGMGWIYAIARDLRVDLLREMRDGRALETEESADVLELLFIHGQPSDQVARSLGVPPELVQSRLNRAIDALRSPSAAAG